MAKVLTDCLTKLHFVVTNVIKEIQRPETPCSNHYELYLAAFLDTCLTQPCYEDTASSNILLRMSSIPKVQFVHAVLSDHRFES